MSEAGDYKFCFDNTFSRISTKTIFFAYMLSNEEDDDDSGEFNQEWMQPEDVYEMKVEDIKVGLIILKFFCTFNYFTSKM